MAWTFHMNTSIWKMKAHGSSCVKHTPGEFLDAWIMRIDVKPSDAASSTKKQEKTCSAKRQPD